MTTYVIKCSNNSKTVKNKKIPVYTKKNKPYLEQLGMLNTYIVVNNNDIQQELKQYLTSSSSL